MKEITGLVDALRAAELHAFLDLLTAAAVRRETEIGELENCLSDGEATDTDEFVEKIGSREQERDTILSVISVITMRTAIG